jgi:hypothetical protein
VRTRLVGVAALALALSVGPAAACPCSDDAGGASGLVRRDERYAVALVATSRHGLGRFDAFGHYSPFADGEGEWSEELLLRAGFRWPRRLEWTGELGYAAYRFHAPGIVEGRTGLGDALLHARYAVWDEGMPHERWRLPALSIAGLVRAPLGGRSTSSASRAPSYGSGGAQLGLGAWELGGGLEITRALVPALELMLGGEAAYRFEDHALGLRPGATRARRLGPRADVVLGVRLLPSAWLSGTLALRGRMNGDVTLNGRRLDGTAERLWSVVAGLGVYERESGLRSSVTLSVDPPVGPPFGMGSTRTAALGVGLGYGAK